MSTLQLFQLNIAKGYRMYSTYISLEDHIERIARESLGSLRLRTFQFDMHIETPYTMY